MSAPKGDFLKAEDEAENSRRVRVLSLSSGKGGVGKTCIAVNLAYWLSNAGSKVLLLDADLGLANVDIVLGLKAEFTLQHVLSGEKSISDIILDGPGGLRVLPAGSGVAELADMSDEAKIQLFSELEAMDEPFDYLLVDTGAGISRQVLYFNNAVQDVVLVATPEPTSITDAYALMKVLSERRKGYRFRILANMVESESEGKNVYRRLSTVSDKYLNVATSYLGHVVNDPNVAQAIRKQTAISVAFPKSVATRCMRNLAKRIHELPHDELPAGHMQFFWRRLAAQAV
ncbi:MinD/ParA family protein [Nitrospinota bacterium]